MPSSNRLQVTSVAEVTLGTTPTTPRMRTRRLTGESLSHRPTFEDQAELRSDRMVADPIQTGTEDGGAINFDFHLPVQGGALDADFASAFYNSWVNATSRDNDGTADSVITNVATTNTEVTHATGTTFVAGQLVRFTGFGVANNNGIFKVSTGGTTTSRYAAAGITDEAAPPAAARMKVVGFHGVSGDITATATGLGSTSLDFTTLQLQVGQWIKIGGTASINQFATAALNGYARITAIAATALTLDHRPTGWTTDAGTGKAIMVWTSDFLKNGTTQSGQTIERGFLGQGTPVYIVNRGMVASQLSMNFEAKRKISGSVTYMGMSGAESTTTLDASPDAASLLANYPVFACSANVGQVYEGGASLASPDYVRSLSFTLNNNITPIEAVDSQGPAGLTGHECTVTGQIRSYFGSNALLTKFYAGTATSIAIRAKKSGAGAGTSGTQAFVLNFPRVTYNGEGSPNASGKNIDIDLPLSFAAAKDESVTNAIITFSRFEYIEE